MRGERIVIDIGEKIGEDDRKMVDYEVMGEGMERELFEVRKKKVGMMNVGKEEVKGIEEIKEEGKIIRDKKMEGIEY